MIFVLLNLLEVKNDLGIGLNEASFEQRIDFSPGTRSNARGRLKIGKKSSKIFASRCVMRQFLLWKTRFERHKKFIQKPIDRSSGFDRFILHPETGEMVQFETSVLASA